MDHDETRALLSDYFDGELSGEERGSLDAHLHVCAECRRELERHGRIDALARSDAKTPSRAETEAFTRAVLRRLEPEPEVAFLDALLSSPRWSIAAFALTFAALFIVYSPLRMRSYGPIESVMISQDGGQTYSWLSRSPGTAAAGALDLVAR